MRIISKNNQTRYADIIGQLQKLSNVDRHRDEQIFEFRRQFGHILNDWQLNGKYLNQSLNEFFNKYEKQLEAAE